MQPNYALGLWHNNPWLHPRVSGDGTFFLEATAYIRDLLRYITSGQGIMTQKPGPRRDSRDGRNLVSDSELLPDSKQLKTFSIALARCQITMDLNCRDVP